PAYGAPDALERIDQDGLRSWHRKIFRPDQMVVSVVGDFRAESVQEMLSERMAGWSAEGTRPLEAGYVAPLKGISQRVEVRKRTQTFQILGFPAADLRSDAKYSLDLL